MSSGGSRPGAGRKPTAPEDKRVQILVSITQETKERLQKMADSKGMKIGRLLDKMIDDFWYYGK